MLRRSRLLYWKTSGTECRSRPSSSRFCLQVGERLLVRLRRRDLAVGHEDDTVDALQHQPPGGVVEHLARHRVELEADLHAADDAHVEREEVEEEGAVGLRLQAHHVPARARGGAGVDPRQVRGLPAQARTVVHDLGRHLHRGVVQEDHGREEVYTCPRGGRGLRSSGRPRTGTGCRAAASTSEGKVSHWYSPRTTSPNGNLSFAPTKTRPYVPWSLLAGQALAVGAGPEAGVGDEAADRGAEVGLGGARDDVRLGEFAGLVGPLQLAAHEVEQRDGQHARRSPSSRPRLASRRS